MQGFKIISRLSFYLILIFSLTACGSLSGRSGFFTSKDSAPQHNVDIASIPNAVPRVEAKSRYGNPASYVVFNKRYFVMADSKDYTARGVASWYGTKFHGRKTSSGEPYDMFAMTAAHRTLPLPTYIQVTNLKNQHQVIVKVNDRGPFSNDRILDLSYAAASKLGILATGTALIDIKAIDPIQHKQHSSSQKPQLKSSTHTDHSSATTTANVTPLRLEAATSKVTPMPLPSSTKKTTPPLAQSTAGSASASIFLQVAAFKERKNAERLRSKLTRLSDTGIHIRQIQQNQNTIYRVSIGPFSSSSEAGKIAETLTLMGFGKPQLRSSQ